MNEYKTRSTIECDKLISTMNDYIYKLVGEVDISKFVRYVPMTYNLNFLGLMIQTNGQPVLDIYLDSDYKWKLPLNKIQSPSNHIDNINLWKHIENYNERGVFERD